MIDNVIDFLRSLSASRLLPIGIVYIILFAILIQQIFSIQITRSDDLEKEQALSSERVREIKSTRGNIYDCNGRLLAYNELSYNVTLEDVDETATNEIKNKRLYNLIQIIEAYDNELAVEKFLTVSKKGKIRFVGDTNAQLRFKKEVYSTTIEDLTEEQKEASAEEVYEYACYSEDANSPKFDIDKEYPMDIAIKIFAIRFAMFLNRYYKYEKLVIARDVDDKTVAAVKENSADILGVDIAQDTTRVYNDSEYFASIIGYTGTVTSERLEELRKEDPDTEYNSTDQIGISGIENEFESYLAGTKGSETVLINESYRITDVKDTKEPVAGKDITLTIDYELQKKCTEILEKRIAGILLSKIQNSAEDGTKGDSASGIRIPIYDVYNALLSNNVIDVKRFTDKNASSLEKATHKKFLRKRKNVLAAITRQLQVNNTTASSQLSDEMEEYMDYVKTILEENEILLRTKEDSTDATYTDYINDKISLSKYLQYAIANKWVDLDKLHIGSDYYTTQEIYEILVQHVIRLLKEDRTFIKKIYSYLIYNYTLSGRDVCLLLYDQGVLAYDEHEISQLKNGMVDAYNFITGKIRKLKITPGQLGLEPCSGAIIVTDVNTGEVKAMVSYPSYDNNKMANKVDSDYYYTYINGNSAYPALNKATQQATAPGSTFKMVSTTAGLEEGVISPGTRIVDKVTFDKIPRPARCWIHSSHGNINASEAIGVSCNYFFYEVGYRLSGISNGHVNNERGLSKLKKYVDMYGLLDKSGVEISEVEPHMSTEDAVRSAIGQGTHLYTPVQLSRYVTTIANSGNCYNLTLVDKITNKNGKVVKNNKAKLHGKVNIADSTWSTIHKGMYEVVYGARSSHTPMFRDLNVTIAGKTGTAQINPYHPNHALFVSYAPYENPEISVTCVIPNGYTSSNAMETARNVYKYYYSKNRKKVKFGVTSPEEATSGVD